MGSNKMILPFSCSRNRCKAKTMTKKEMKIDLEFLSSGEGRELGKMKENENSDTFAIINFDV
jgi:hypothetical protein